MPATPQTANNRRRWRIEHADCLQALAKLAADSVDVVITDPPYGIGFNGMAWDGPAIKKAAASEALGWERAGGTGAAPIAFQAFCAKWAAECLRVLKPGGHLAVFGSPRTFHRLTCGVEEAGFQTRDVLMWLYGQGFPKSRNLTGAARGWGTALRPSYEPILLARKPLRGPTHANHARHGTGALHIDACRIPHRTPRCPGEGRDRTRSRQPASSGRWPANLAVCHTSSCTESRCEQGCPAALLGERQRFFYCAKASRAERDAGCEQLSQRTIQTFQIGAENHRRADAKPVGNIHPTVKPLELMRWLVRLLTPPGGLVLDPFAGSGSTGAAAVREGARFLGIEREADYIPIARARITHWAATARRSSRNGKP